MTTRKLVDIRSHETVGVRKALVARPAIKRTDLRYFVKRCVIPLANRVVDVALGFEIVGHRLGRRGNDGVVARKAHGGERMTAQADRMRIASRHQSGARRRAQGRRVKVVVAKPTCRKPIDVRRID